MNLLIKNKGGNPLPETTLKNKAKTSSCSNKKRLQNFNLKNLNKNNKNGRK